VKWRFALAMHPWNGSFNNQVYKLIQILWLCHLSLSKVVLVSIRGRGISDSQSAFLKVVFHYLKHPSKHSLTAFLFSFYNGFNTLLAFSLVWPD